MGFLYLLNEFLEFANGFHSETVLEYILKMNYFLHLHHSSALIKRSIQDEICIESDYCIAGIRIRTILDPDENFYHISFQTGNPDKHLWAGYGWSINYNQGSSYIRERGKTVARWRPKIEWLI